MGFPKNTYQLINDGYQSLKKGKYSDAILILEKVLSTGTGDLYILFLLAVAYLYISP